MYVKWLSYTFEVFSPSVLFNDVPGIYIFAGTNPLGNWHPIYIGQAASFRNRFANHERWNEALRKGVSSIHAMVVTDQRARDVIERELIRAYQPPLNDQLK